MNNEILTLEQVQEIIKTFPIKPLFNKVVVTLNTEEVDNHMVLSENVMSEVQYVISKGENVTQVEEGQKIILDLESMMERFRSEENSHEVSSRVKIDPFPYEGHMFAIIDDRRIKAKYIN